MYLGSIISQASIDYLGSRGCWSDLWPRYTSRLGKNSQGHPPFPFARVVVDLFPKIFRSFLAYSKSFTQQLNTYQSTICSSASQLNYMYVLISQCTPESVIIIPKLRHSIIYIQNESKIFHPFPPTCKLGTSHDTSWSNSSKHREHDRVLQLKHLVTNGAPITQLGITVITWTEVSLRHLWLCIANLGPLRSHKQTQNGAR